MSERNTSPVRRILILLLLAASLAAAGYYYVRYQEMYPSTDDAYIHGNLIFIAPQVTGQLIEVNVSDFDEVTKGQVIARIDPAPYQAKLAQAQAAYERATSANKAVTDAVSAASAQVKAASAKLQDTQSRYTREMALVNKGVLSKQEGDDLKAQLLAAENELDSARAKVQQLLNQQGAQGNDAPEVKEAAAVLEQATLNLSYTDILSPVSGRLGTVKARKGSVVAAGQSLMPLIQADSYWIQANYKEADIGRLTPGMHAKISMDMYPDKVFKGEVDAISPASGSSFSLLPPENATGNWVKVPQRFPVRLRILTTPDQPNLRVGANVTVTVDTQTKPRKIHVTPSDISNTDNNKGQ